MAVYKMQGFLHPTLGYRHLLLFEITAYRRLDLQNKGRRVKERFGMGIEVTRVGKRWFHCISSQSKIVVEATSSNRIKFVENPDRSKKAGYQVWDRIPYTDWTLTGKGANKYREEIVAALEEKLANE